MFLTKLRLLFSKWHLYIYIYLYISIYILYLILNNIFFGRALGTDIRINMIQLCLQSLQLNYDAKIDAPSQGCNGGLMMRWEDLFLYIYLYIGIGYFSSEQI